MPAHSLFDRRGRAALLVFFLAVAAYANSLGNGLAYDDDGVIAQNPVVTGGDWRGALAGPWWPQSVAGAGLYRPVTSASFALEWGASGGSPLAFHALNVVAHAAVSVLVFLLLLELGSAAGALVGAAVFAIHPVHTEAVANVVGRAELYAAAFYLGACLLYWRGRAWTGPRRALRLVGLGALYALSLGSKEIGVTVPGALLLLELAGPRLDERAHGSGAALDGVRREGATWLLLGVVLAAYLGARFLVLGTVAGEQVAPTFAVVGPGGRVLTAVATWLQYLRLLLFPADLVSDYDPAVVFPSEGFDLGVALGLAAIAALLIVAVRAWRRAPLVTVGIAFFALAILPVSNLLFSTGTVLAERTLYLPSVGLGLVAAGLTAVVLAQPARVRRVATAAAAVAAIALLLRTVSRNPAWMSTFVVVQTLSDEHPESWRAFRGRAQGLERIGDAARAGAEWDQAVRLAPTNYTLLVQAADFHARLGDPAKADAYLRGAIRIAPELANAYQHLATQLLRRGQGRDAHRVALEGLARSGDDRVLWDLVSESYVAKGDLPAAVRAREASLGLDPSVAAGWRRMAELLEAAGDTARAQAARTRAAAAERGKV